MSVIKDVVSDTSTKTVDNQYFQRLAKRMKDVNNIGCNG